MFALGLAVFTVIALSAMCSLFEAALYSVPMSRIEALMERGRPSGKILQSLRQRVEEPITAILSLNTIANTAGAAVAGALAAKVLGEQWLVWFSAVFTMTILIASEVVPKTAGVVYARELAAMVARPIAALTWLFRPVVWLCGFVTRLIARDRGQDSVSPDELVVMARLGRRTGSLQEGESRVIENILTMKTRFAKQVMTPSTVVFSLPATLRVEEIYLDERVATHSRFPVYGEDQDDPIGVVHSRDVLLQAAKDHMSVTLGEICKPIHFLADNTPLDKALAGFLEHDDHIAAVVGEFGEFAGVLTLEDVLEEVLGREIVDETDRHEDLRALARQRREELLVVRK